MFIRSQTRAATLRMKYCWASAQIQWSECASVHSREVCVCMRICLCALWTLKRLVHIYYCWNSCIETTTTTIIHLDILYVRECVWTWCASHLSRCSIRVQFGVWCRTSETVPMQLSCSLVCKFKMVFLTVRSERAFLPFCDKINAQTQKDRENKTANANTNDALNFICIFPRSFPASKVFYFLFFVYFLSFLTYNLLLLDRLAVFVRVNNRSTQTHSFFLISLSQNTTWNFIRFIFSLSLNDRRADQHQNAGSYLFAPFIWCIAFNTFWI